MASSLTPFLPSVNNANLSSSSTISSLSILKKKSIASKHGKPNHYYASRVACKAADDDKKNPISSQDEQEAHLGMFDRRNILLGIGGLYGAASSLSNNPFAIAVGDGSNPKPVPPPELGSCHVPSGLPTTWAKVKTCCPPVPPDPSKIITFSEHLKRTNNTKIRVRPAAHTVANDPKYLRKFEKAIQAMKDLDPSDPRNFSQQANVHCAYCNGGYPQLPQGSTDTLQVHFSWLFLPFHRLYLYFFEKILGKLVGDPYFAMPFWNWDHPDGMHMPTVYTDNVRSPLFDRFRNMAHLAPALVDFNYNRNLGDLPNDKIQLYNLKIMHKQVIHSNTPELFMGQCYRAGSKESRSGSGALELIPHNTVHAWVGDLQMPNNEDMGHFYSAGNDPLFYAHHSNVDRLWSEWKSLGDDPFRKDFTCKDWLDTGFVFYDQDGYAVKVTVRDCLDTKNLGYDYQKVDNLWVSHDYRPTARLASKRPNAPRPTAPTVEQTSFPVVLDSVKKFYVKRPEKKPAADENVILLIEDIEFLGSDSVKFDVLLNDEDDESCTPENTEFLTSFTNVASGNGLIKSNLKTNITDILEDLKVSDDDETVLVTLVPKFAGNKLSVGGIKIQLEKKTTELTCL